MGCIMFDVSQLSGSVSYLLISNEDIDRALDDMHRKLDAAKVNTKQSRYASARPHEEVRDTHHEE